MTTLVSAQGDTLQQAQAMTQQVLALYGQGRFADAVPIAERVVAIHERVLGPDDENTATALNNLGQLYLTVGDLAKAEPVLRRALTIREKVLPPGDHEIATSLNNLGNVYLETAAFAKAEEMFQRVLTMDEKAFGRNHPDTAHALTNLGSVYLKMGAYSQAEPYYQQVVEIRERALDANDPQMAVAVNNLAELYEQMGDYARAEPLLRKALAINQTALGPEHPVTAQALDNLGVLYEQTGEYARSETLIRQALGILQKTLGANHPAVGRAMNNLTLVYSATDRYPEAESLLRQSAEIFEKVYGPNHPDTLGALANLGTLYVETLQYARAKPVIEGVARATESTAGPNHPDTAAALEGLGHLYYATGDFARADPATRRALAIYQQTLGPEHPQTARTLNNLGAVRWAAGDPAAALGMFADAQRIQETNTRRFLLSGSEARKQAYMARATIDAFVDVSFSLAAGARATLLGATRVLEYKGRVLDAMSDSVSRLRRAVRPQDRELFDRAAGVAQQFSTLTLRGPGDLPLETYRARLAELRQEQESLETELADRSAEFRRQREPVTVERVQHAIPPDAVLLEWFRYLRFDPRADKPWGAARYVVYVLKQQGDPVAVDIGDAEPIEALVRDFRLSLSDPNRTDVKEIAEELSDKLVRPLQSHVTGVQRILVSPDGALNLLPFAALVDDKREYLMQRFDISYLTSGRDLLRDPSAAVGSEAPMLVADPDYGSPLQSTREASVSTARSPDLDRGGLVFAALAGTAAEAAALQPLLGIPEDRVLTHGAATEERLKALHGPRLLHIATHGFFLTDRQLASASLAHATFGGDVDPAVMGAPLLRSGLALAGANARRSGAADDGILTAAEVAQLDLAGTQLVVLSACETGVGDVKNGEGVYGLRRALVLAGAQTQVASLWKVADGATKDLMVDYYRRLLRGEGRADALRSAQRTMMSAGDRSHPYYWAAFVAIGDWTPLPAQR